MSVTTEAWTDQQRERFLAGLLRLPLAPAYDDLVAWCQAHGRTVPSAQTEQQRARCLVWLSEQANAERVKAWAAQVAQARESR